MADHSFNPQAADLELAVRLLLQSSDTAVQNLSKKDNEPLSDQLPQTGIGERATLELLAPIVFDGAAKLGSDVAFAHMDPPTPWITWMMQCWNASLNQNLLHPDVSPIAGKLEDRVVQWLVPYFGMSGGHLTPGSTVSNLTALWAARDLRDIKQVVASTAAHLSIDKAARILGLELIKVPCTAAGQIDKAKLPSDLSQAALVLTAGTTSEGAIDPLDLIGNAAWSHVDAAWAGALRFSSKHADKLDNIDAADSVCVSAHKWLFQPKECGLLMFKDVRKANEVLTISGAYLARPNVGLLGSHGASAIPLLATLMAWGRTGLANRIEQAMINADNVVEFLKRQNNVDVFGVNRSGVVLWRSKTCSAEKLVQALPPGAASLTTVAEQQWVRHVSANPNVDIKMLCDEIEQVLIRQS